MNMYNFDMQALLGAFNDDPTQLADAFTKQLNEALAAKRREEELKNKANQLAEEWNKFVKEYFEIHYPKLDVENYLFRNGEELTSFIEVIVQAMPEVEKYLNVVQTLNNQKDKTKDLFNNIIPPAVDNFKETMQDFFDKYGI